MKANVIYFATIACFCLLTGYTKITGQSGGGFEITDGVITTGGGPAASGIFAADLVIGQPVQPGVSASGNFSITSGFWNYTALAPTAASISISGSVVDDAGAPVANAILYLQTQDGDLFTAQSSSFGIYRFDNITAGQALLISVRARRYNYAPRMVFAVDEISGFDFRPEQ